MVTTPNEFDRPHQIVPRKKRWSYREKLLLLALILALGAGHFRTFVQVNKQISTSAGKEADDSPPTTTTIREEDSAQREDTDVVPQQQPTRKEDEETRQLEENKSVQEQTAKTEAKGSPPGKASTSLESNDAFYRSHKEQMKKLFSKGENFIIWEARNKKETFKGLWSYFPNVYRPNRDPKTRQPNVAKTPYYFASDLCTIAQTVSDEVQAGKAVPHVAFIRLNENWGGLSQYIPNKTTDWGRNVWGSWKRMGCSRDMILNYLDHPYCRGVFTMQHQMIDHPKAHSLPLGIAFASLANRVKISQRQLTGKASDRTQQLMISHKNRPMRKEWTEQVIANFDNKVANSFGKGKQASMLYYEELLRSRFILSPSGLGMDCYRHWESIYLGTIPVIETLDRKDGWFRTFDDLPVAWIDNYANLTPEFLEKEYQRILGQEYQYEKLTHRYWIDFIRSRVEGVTVESLGTPPMILKSGRMEATTGEADLGEAKPEAEANGTSEGTGDAKEREAADAGGEEEVADTEGNDDNEAGEEDADEGVPIKDVSQQKDKAKKEKKTPKNANILPLPAGVEPVKPGSPEEAFYSFHREHVLSLVNVSSAMIWNTRSDNPFKPLYDEVGYVYKVNRKIGNTDNPDLSASPFIFWGSICEVSKAFKKYRTQPGAKPLPHVLFFRMNENWGGFSEYVEGKTADWVKDLPKAWKKEGCTKESIFEYLDHPDTRAGITVQFQRYSHPKVHSLPLGLMEARKLTPLLDRISPSPPQNRPNLLMINSKPRVMRDAAVNKVIENFGGKIQNTYNKNSKGVNNYYRELSLSKFILSPGGLGFDCYRHWEAIIAGTIPVLETLNREDGWFKSLEDLPVAWIDKYENLTPEFLEAEHQRIISQPASYKYEKLSRHFWVDFIRSQVADVLESEPGRPAEEQEDVMRAIAAMKTDTEQM